MLGTSSIVTSGCAVSSDPSSSAPTAEDADSVSSVSSAIEGENLAGTNLAGTNLAGTNLGGRNLAGTNLAGTNLAGTNLAGTNLAGTNLAGTNLAGTNLAGTNLAGTNLAGTNLAGTNLAGRNLAGTNLAGRNLAGTNLAGAGVDIHDTGTTGLLYSGEDLLEPASDRALVFGIGGTVLPRLLSQQSPNARISVAVGKLPWGFSATAGGPVTTDAWEAIVWGDRGYAVFVLGAPPGTAWSGIAGFIKALFRWNAPPTQSVDITGIAASATVDPTVHTSVVSYTGMMGAAAKLSAGSVTEADFIAGELALVTATTNNRSVMVDFSGWVRDASSGGQVLANVESVAKPWYAESAYSAYRQADGTLGVSVSPVVVGNDMISASDELGVSYAAYRSGLAPKPSPTRCPAALFLNARYGEPIPGDQCDSGVDWVESSPGYPSGGTTWASVAGTTAPMNGYQSLPSGTAPFLRTAGRAIASEVYTFLWEPNHELPTRAVGGSTGVNRASLGVATSSAPGCASGDDPADAFDPTSSGGWCTTLMPTFLTPRALAYAWGGSIPITSYSLTSGADPSAADPRSWTFQGCDGTCAVDSDAGWSTLDTRGGESFARVQKKTYAFSNTRAYSQYRLRVTAGSKIALSMQLRLVELFDSGGAVSTPAGTDRTENGTVTWTGKACSKAELATRAFDNLDTAANATRWCVSAAPSEARPIAVAYRLPAAGSAVTSYRLTASSDSPSRDPRDWTLEGCNGTCRVGNDDGWVQLDARTNETFSKRYQTKSYPVSTAASYSQYRLRITRTKADDQAMQLGELEIF